MQTDRILIYLIFLLTACVAPSKEKGARGVGISNASEGNIRRSLANYVSQNGFDLVKSDLRTLSFDRPADKWTAIRHASFVNPGTFVRMQIFVMEVGPTDFWIGFEAFVVTERGSGFEKMRSLKGKVIQKMQLILEDWRSQFVANLENQKDENRG